MSPSSPKPPSYLRSIISISLFILLVGVVGWLSVNFAIALWQILFMP